MEALRDSGMLDTAEERAFDAITRTTKKLFGVPFCLITLVDETRQWFKSCNGLDFCETSRDAAFCAHAILPSAPDVLVVRDARTDGRFAGNPLVTGEPFIRCALRPHARAALAPAPRL
jgi:diguanylate cyclase